MKFTKKDLFFCYDFGLKSILKENNVPYITTALSKNNKRFWLYFRDEKINKIIKQYTGK